MVDQALKQYDEAAKDLFQLMKTEPKNTAGKKELDVVLELCREVRDQLWLVWKQRYF